MGKFHESLARGEDMLPPDVIYKYGNIVFHIFHLKADIHLQDCHHFNLELQNGYRME